MEIAAILRRNFGLNLRPVFAPVATLSRSDTLDPSRIRRVLVTKLRHHGDVLLASPVLGTLNRYLPQAQIDALVYHDTRDMLSEHPALRDRKSVV